MGTRPNAPPKSELGRVMRPPARTHSGDPLKIFAPLLLTLALGGSALAAPADPSAAGGNTVSRLRGAFGANVRVLMDDVSGQPRSVRGLAIATHGLDSADRASRFLAERKTVLGLEHAELAVVRTEKLPVGEVVRFAQRVGDLEVEGRTLAVKLDAAGRVTGINSDLVPFDLQRPKALIDAAQAQAAVHARFAVAATGTPRQVVLVPAPGLARIAWRVPTAVIPLAAHFDVWVDAETGDILRSSASGKDQPMRTLPVKETSR